MKARRDPPAPSNILRRTRPGSPPQSVLSTSLLAGYDDWTGEWTGDWSDDGADDHTHDTERLDMLDLKAQTPASPGNPPVTGKDQLLGLLAAITQHSVAMVRTGGGARLVVPSDALFEPSRSKLTSAGVLAVSSLAKAFIPFPTLRIQVEGHTDSLPQVQATRLLWQLGFERAIAVRDRLVVEGVRRSRVHGLTFAGTRPIASNASEAGRAHNRRIELLVLGST